MSNESFDDRHKAGEQRIAERNAAELGQTLEGPDSEARLERLRGKFKSVNTGSRANQPGMATLIVLGVAVFLTILIFGLGKPIIEMLAPK
jgi:hypothetical protein